MDAITILVGLVALAVGYVLGIALEYFIACVYFQKQKRTIDRLKLELEEAKAKAKEDPIQIIEIFDDRKQPENYFEEF